MTFLEKINELMKEIKDQIQHLEKSIKDFPNIGTPYIQEWGFTIKMLKNWFEFAQYIIYLYNATEDIKQPLNPNKFLVTEDLTGLIDQITNIQEYLVFNGDIDKKICPEMHTIRFKYNQNLLNKINYAFRKNKEI
jgi:hypothetical protein